MPVGTVKWFNFQKGYGYIQPQSGSKDVFVHISAVEKAGLSGLNEGQVVEYEKSQAKERHRRNISRFNADIKTSLHLCTLAALAHWEEQ